MLVLRRVLDQFCEQNQVRLDDPLAIAAAQELVRLWQTGDPTEAELASDLAHLMPGRHGALTQSGAELQF
ncbi:hypothetical protein ACRQ1B_13670 [Rhizobium panacihumi]|uniref:hypothetical protein n=1 Tax=Rhizobium panacihumi TaxID=2008450 RepID=UPI003D79E11D